MIRKIFPFAFFIFSIPVFSQNLGFQMAPGQRRAVIPIEVSNNLVIVPVVLNNALPLKFIIDTGVRTAILTQKTFSDILNLQYVRRYSISAPGNTKQVDAYITTNVSLELPGVVGRGHAMLVLGEDYLELRNYLGTDVHGILGYELFSRFIVEIDYEKRQMILRLPENFHKPKKFRSLPITVEDTKPYVKLPVTLDDGTVINAKLMMDSGASHGLMLDPATDPAIKVPGHVVSSTIGRGLGGEITGKVGRIKLLEMKDYEVANAIANFPDPNSYIDTLKMTSVSRNGSLGGEIMSRFTMIYNFPKEEVYFKKNTYFKKKFYYNLSGIIVKAKGSKLNVFEIREIRPQSVAESAGFLPGDLITLVNGIDTRNLTLDLLNGVLNSKPGRRVTLEIERNGLRQKVQFRLADEI